MPTEHARTSPVRRVVVSARLVCSLPNFAFKLCFPTSRSLVEPAFFAAFSPPLCAVMPQCANAKRRQDQPNPNPDCKWQDNSDANNHPRDSDCPQLWCVAHVAHVVERWKCCVQGPATCTTVAARAIFLDVIATALPTDLVPATARHVVAAAVLFNPGVALSALPRRPLVAPPRPQPGHDWFPVSFRFFRLRCRLGLLACVAFPLEPPAFVLFGLERFESCGVFGERDVAHVAFCELV